MQQNFIKTIQVGLNTLNDPNIRISSVDIEDIANLKALFRAILNKQLIIVTPEVISTNESHLPKQESDISSN